MRRKQKDESKRRDRESINVKKLQQERRKKNIQSTNLKKKGIEGVERETQ